MLDALLAPRRRAHGSGLAVAIALHAAVVAVVLLRHRAPPAPVDVDLGPGPRIVKPGQSGGRSKAPAPGAPIHDEGHRQKLRLRVRSHIAPTAPEPPPSTRAAVDEPLDAERAGPSAGVGDGASGDGSADASGGGGAPGEIIDATGVVRPTPRCAPPRMPEAARQMGITGAVVARYVVEPDGSVSAIEIVNPSAPAILIDAVRAWLSACHFEPASIGGHAARVRMTQPFLFRIH